MNARELRIERKLAEKRRAAKAAPEPDLAIPLAPPENPLRGKSCLPRKRTGFCGTSWLSMRERRG